MRINSNIEKKEISDEWDKICEARQRLIEEERDISLLTVTGPCMLRNIREEAPKALLDIGCGTGYLTDKVAELVDKCFGIDISGKSIEVAKEKYYKENLFFVQSDIKDFETEMQFDVCMSNMVFMTDPEWLLSVKKIYEVLKTGGSLLITITHPCFWPRYWKYQDEAWFDYNSEIYIKHDFSISLEKFIGQTTHIHRPLIHYFEGLINSGFIIERIEEPYHVTETPEGYEYTYPRFLFLKCRKK